MARLFTRFTVLERANRVNPSHILLFHVSRQHARWPALRFREGLCQEILSILDIRSDWCFTQKPHDSRMLKSQRHCDMHVPTEFGHVCLAAGLESALTQQQCGLMPCASFPHHLLTGCPHPLQSDSSVRGDMKIRAFRFLTTALLVVSFTVMMAAVFIPNLKPFPDPAGAIATFSS